MMAFARNRDFPRDWRLVEGDGFSAWLWARNRALREELALWCGRTAQALGRGGAGLASVAGGLSGKNLGWALAMRTNRGWLAACDRVRSVPLFYKAGDSSSPFRVGESARELGDGRLVTASSLAVLDFALCGYVTGQETLYEGVRGVQAGELAWLPDQGRPETQRYYRFLHRESAVSDERELFPLLDAAYREAFGLLASDLAGRQLLVPLSGGMDSRLVLAGLVEAGLDNILCFSYGPPNSWEVATARAVAKRAAAPWRHVPFSRGAWRAAYASEAWERAESFAWQGVSLFNPAEWLAIPILQSQGLLEPGAVFLPGHTGDFISGGHIPKFLAKAPEASESEIIYALLDKHHGLWRPYDQDPALKELIFDRVRNRVDGLSWDGAVAGANAFECWEWQERQAKFIVNSVRGIEAHGYSWRLPLWENPFMDAWARAPLRYRLRQGLYRAWLAERNPAGLFARKAAPPPFWEQRGGRAKQLYGLAGDLGARLLPAGLLKRVSLFRNYFRHPMAITGVLGPLEYWRESRGARNLNSLLTSRILQRLGLKDSPPRTWRA